MSQVILQSKFLPILFYYLNKTIKSISLPSGVISIGDYAFYDCSSLESITIPSSVTSIGNSAFYNCSALASITVEAVAPPTLGNSAFNNTSANLIIYVPSESVETYKATSKWSNYASRIQAIPTWSLAI